MRGSLGDWCRGSFAGLSMRIAGRSLPIRNIANDSSFCPAGLIFMNSESSPSFVGGGARQWKEWLGSSERATGLVFIKSKSSSAFVEGRARQ